MTECRVCGTSISGSSYRASPPALTTVAKFLDIETCVYVCRVCGHAQSDDIPEVQAFYDHGYKISLESEDHDQIISKTEVGLPVYRTDHQCAIGLHMLDIPPGAAVLDYGAAKADTLRKMTLARPDIVPHVFDVSRDYREAWQGWVSTENQATHSVPENWKARFQVIISHFVIEHVSSPVAFLARLKSLLVPSGHILISMPSFVENPGDLLVADHPNHFSETSLLKAIELAGLKLDQIDPQSFPGAMFAVVSHTQGNRQDQSYAATVDEVVRKADGLCKFWRDASATLVRNAQAYKSRPAAIYGAGFYGNWVYSRISLVADVRYFVDQNPKLQGSKHYDLPVIAADALPDEIEVLFAGLNPLRARDIILNQNCLVRPTLSIAWLDA